MALSEGQLAGLIIGVLAVCLLLYLCTLWRGFQKWRRRPSYEKKDFFCHTPFLLCNKYCFKAQTRYKLPSVLYHVEKTEPSNKRSRRKQERSVDENGHVNILFKDDSNGVPKESVNRLKTKRVSFSIDVIEKDEQETTEEAIYNGIWRTLNVLEPPIRESAETYPEVDLET